MKPYFLLGGLIAASVGLLFFKGGLTTVPLWPQPTKQVQEVSFAGAEEPDPDPDSLHVNGFVIKNHGNIRLKDFYTRYEKYLGPPISAFSGRQMAFFGGRVTYSPDHEEAWKLEIESLGIVDAQIAGVRITQSADPHPVVRQYLVAEYEAGVDLLRVYGPPVTEAQCTKATCSQWLAKQKLSWPAGDVTADHVVREPLGLYVTFPKTRIREVPDDERGNTVPMPLLIGGALILGLLIRVRSGGGGRRPSKI